MKHLKPISFLASLIFMTAIVFCAVCPRADAQTPPLKVITPTQIIPNVNSCKVDYTPIAGVADYRLVDWYPAGTPMPNGQIAPAGGELNDATKYAGVEHVTAGWAGWNLDWVRDAQGNPVYPLQTNTTPVNDGTNSGHRIDIPGWEIERNAMTPGKKYWVVLQGVNLLGPFPPGNAYNSVNALTGTVPKIGNANDPMFGMQMPGSNMGATGDGWLTTNGQGPSTNTPVVVAQSAPFEIYCGIPPPVNVLTHTTVLSDFSNCAMTGPFGVDKQAGNETYNLVFPAPSGGKQVWNAVVLAADVVHSSAFVESSHFMDVLFDGGGPGSSLPMHNNHAALALTPQQTIEFGGNVSYDFATGVWVESGGWVLHETMEVDGQFDGRRWFAFVISPYNDPIQSFYSDPGFRVNGSNQALFIEFQGQSVNVVEQTGPAAAPGNPAPLGTQNIQNFLRPAIVGQAMTPVNWGPSGLADSVAGQQFQQIGRGLDDRSRFDFFLSQAGHLQVYEDGLKCVDTQLAQPLPFARVKSYFAHYVYHTTNEVNENSQFTPWETYWINRVPYSDMRHWNNLGVEVLPNTPGQWANNVTLCQPAKPVPLSAAAPNTSVQTKSYKSAL